MSTKFQIVLPDDLAEELKTTAAKLGTPLAQLIRETMREKLRQVKSYKPAQDPFSWMDSLVDAGDTDLSSRVDEVLYRDASIH